MARERALAVLVIIILSLLVFTLMFFDQNSNYSFSVMRDIRRIIKESNRVYMKEDSDAALKILDEGLEIYPDSASLYLEKGKVYVKKNKKIEALKWFYESIRLDPDLALYDLLSCLNDLKKHDERLIYLRYKYDKNPSYDNTLNLVWGMRHANNYTDYDELMPKIMEAEKEYARQGNSNFGIFKALHFNFTLEDLQSMAAFQAFKINFKSEKIGSLFSSSVSYKTKMEKNKKLRVGYLSYDFRSHAVGIIFQSVFQFHNKDEFEIFAYNAYDKPGSLKNDEIFRNIEREADHMVLIHGMSLNQIVKRIVNDEIDILIDLGHYTKGNRLDVMSMKPAPITVAGIGLASTTGSHFIDYLIADNYVVPPEYMEYYSEKLILMPHSYHPFSHISQYGNQKIEKMSRKANRLPEDKVILCNFASYLRTTPEYLDIVAEILVRSPNAVFVSKTWTFRTKALLAEFEKRGVSSDRIYFLPHTNRDKHIAQKAMCDLHLDVCNLFVLIW
eukprot:TRINITY_DN11870_c0_g1_i2.p1 TRINITY_DN11870_c0_g1~~TRINITY_DN11870_c0_g1_i2.p1  ORF type:complete len:501 (+),score=92.09 TRINITY_DN11870_c0_g1_i2:84-1586(+)